MVHETHRLANSPEEATIPTTEPRTWFITGAGRGLGHAFATAALDAGDRVVATARDATTLLNLEAAHPGRVAALRLDVTDRDAAAEAVARAVDRFGRIDVVVNNAGYGLMGAVEEITEDQARSQMETNFFGALWVTQAVIPQLRAQGSGHIIQISSVGAVGAMPTFGLYNASKWALEGFSASAAEELRPFGISVTMAQLGGFDTDWAGSSMRFATANPAYDETRLAILGTAAYPDPSAPPQAEPEDSDPEWVDAPPAEAAAALLALVDNPHPPVRQIIGTGAHQMVNMALAARRADYEADAEFVWP
ncbi:NAD(P)-dependent dehydrogenase (short-subunit alcohol dehydrogenase family) [Rhodococcus sp. PvR044]|uniref:SDR family NAD(P)-dependent oxidoreductase n=1 Tax=Rhodococcus sp. PvR044 TaxID=3156402 RepID=UPI000BD0470C|nr:MULTISPECIES: SDR family NAD(P)-dependent oxidoreductase [unclassified Rhodococcus (in: high G+C Gram-positive bacteria)]MBP1157959.1 NAD(P)-dependent dehydrogenase (short-subunit alcohol dehydrogenase family) [Rhodococcus sp. PvR099]PTR37804.1 NADP-dependent 3-hydroxy acid dehydrogenase YdfG [Rhodococcus sp. OK611]SNX93235.1 NADP-dependent 3-hydroxy acid dehydrogenase YdfG [Rhodococcus sp. OK270]